MSAAPAILSHGAKALAQGASGMIGGGQIRFVRQGGWRIVPDYPKFPYNTIDFRFAPDGKRVGVRSGSNLTVYDFPSGREVCRILHPSLPQRYSFSFGPEGRFLISSPPMLKPLVERPTMLAKFIDSETGKTVREIPLADVGADIVGAGSPIWTSPTGEIAVVGANAGNKGSAIVVVDLNSQSIRHVLNQTSGSAHFSREMAISSAGILAVQEQNGNRYWEPSKLNLFDLETGKRIAVLPANRPMLTAVAWSRDGSRLYTAGNAPATSLDLRNDPEKAKIEWGEAEPIWVWDGQAHARIGVISEPKAPVDWFAPSPDGRLLCAIRAKRKGGLGAGLSVWRLSDNAEIFSYETPDARLINGAAFTPDGSHLAWLELDEFKVFQVAG